MTFAPRFSPDGNQVVMSLARNGVTDIYRMDLRTRQVTQLTNSPSIDTSPSYSPDGTQITFNSDRGGTQQPYVMAANGGRSEEHTSELQSLMRISYAVFCMKKNKNTSTSDS